MIKDQDIRGGQVVQQMHGMQKEGELLESRIRAGGRQLSQRDATIRGKQTRIDQLLQEGRGLEGEHKARMRAGGRQLSQRDATIRGKEQRIGQLLQEGRSLDKEFVDLRTEANRRIQNLEKRLNDGTADREAAQKEIDSLTKQLAAAGRAAETKEQKQAVAALRDDIKDLKQVAQQAVRSAAAPAAAPSGAPPIVVQGGHGGGGASAGGSSSSGGAAAGGGPGGGGRDLSRTVEALAKAVKGARKGDTKPAKKAPGAKGITQARRAYTDKRKAKMGELRALKSKRLREFNQRTKTMKKGERDRARREYKKKVDAQFKEAQQRFPTARGLKSVAAIRELIRKLDAFRAAK
jgi:chromosome segregation ATPase